MPGPFCGGVREGDGGRLEGWRRRRGFALGALNWSEDAFWRCSWRGLADAWAGYSRFVLGLDPDEADMTRDEARRLDAAFRAWQRGES